MNEDIRIESTSSNAYAIYLDDEHIDTIDKLKNAPDRINAELEEREITSLAQHDKQANVHTSVTSALTRLKTITRIGEACLGLIGLTIFIYVLGSFTMFQLGAQEAYQLFSQATLASSVLIMALALLATLAYLVLGAYYTVTLFRRSALSDSDLVLSRLIKQRDLYADPDHAETR